MFAEPGCPIDPIAVIGAFCPFHLDMPFDGSVGVAVEDEPIFGGKIPASLLSLPVFVADPMPGLFGMTAPRPAVQLQVGKMPQGFEGGFGGDRGVVVGPSADDRIESPDQGGLGGRLVLMDDLPEGVGMLTDGCLAGFDEEFELMPRLSGMGFAHAIVANVVAEKVKADQPEVRMERMGYAGFGRFQF